jgi:hypothetical protein
MWLRHAGCSVSIGSISLVAEDAPGRHGQRQRRALAAPAKLLSGRSLGTTWCYRPSGAVNMRAPVDLDLSVGQSVA